LDKDSRELLIDGGKGGWASYLVWTHGQITTSSGLTLPEWFIYTLSNRDKDSHSKLTPYQTCSAIAYERPNADLTEDDVQKLLAENACGRSGKLPRMTPKIGCGSGKLNTRKARVILRQRGILEPVDPMIQFRDKAYPISFDRRHALETKK
jgi:hypothetical protein